MPVRSWRPPPPPIVTGRGWPSRAAIGLFVNGRQQGERVPCALGPLKNGIIRLEHERLSFPAHETGLAEFRVFIDGVQGAAITVDVTTRGGRPVGTVFPGDTVSLT